MAAPTNGSHVTTALSPTAAEAFSPHVLSSSMSSLSSSTSARPTTSYVSKTYRQASSLFLTRRLPEALSTILPLITPPPPPPPPPSAEGTTEPAPVARSSRNTRTKIWTLYIAILDAIAALEPEEGREAFGKHEWRGLCAKVRDGDVWEEVVRDGYHGVEGDVDPDVVINLATLLLTHARTQALNQKRLEGYLAAAAAAAPPSLDLSGRFAAPPARPPRRRSPPGGAGTPRDLGARVKILELYALHVLARNGEWDRARGFVGASPVLDDERREAFLQALQSLREGQLDAERRGLEEEEEEEERRRREEEEERLRRDADAEEARRQRVGNEELGGRRRAGREGGEGGEGGEVDYGVDRGSVGGSSAGRPGRSGPRRAGGAPSRSPRSPRSTAAGGGAPPRRSKAVAPPSLVARAAGVFADVRAVTERVGGTLRTNPMLLLRFLTFIMGLVLIFGRRNVRERMARILGTSWNKVKATAGMGVKVSYI